MKILFDESSSVRKVLGKQSLPADAGLRIASFIVREPVENGTAVYHALFKKMILLTPEEDRAFTSIDRNAPLFQTFAEEYFYVPEGFDEIAAVDQVRDVLRLIAKPEPLHRFVVLPTTDCNARCFYCYEAGCEKSRMTLETADRVASFMKESAKGKEIKITWFGGEPTYRGEVIDRITARLTELGADFTSDMISNAYLFDEEMAEKAVNAWRLKTIQITLDGTENVYNRRKAYIYREGSAFHRVIRNIGLLANKGVKVNVRLNVDEKNADDLLDLVCFLKDRFGGHPRINVYSRLLYGEMENPAAYGAYYRVRDALKEAGLTKEGGVSRRFKVNRCMADALVTAVVLPDGRLHSCEHFNETGEPWGSIDDTSGQKAAVKKWSELVPKGDQCRDCSFMPDCMRITRCPVVKGLCSLPEKEMRIRELREGVRTEYERYRTGAKKDSDDETA